MNQTTLIRLTLAKTFLIKAQNALKQGSDDLSLATALVDMHDCLDNFIGVLSSELQADRPSKDYLVNRFSKVSEKYLTTYSESLPSQAEVNLLNEMRNGVKHNGVLPNTTQVISTIKVLTDFCNKVSHKVFGIKLEDVSLISQVTNGEKRTTLEAIERDITDKKYKEAMEKAAVALFEYFDKHAGNLSGLQLAIAGYGPGGKKGKTNVFPDRRIQDINLQLLEQGIDPYLYYRFGNMVPKIGYDNLEDQNLIYEYSSLWWHDKNWTAENATFCLNFLTKLFLGQQRKYDGYHIVYRRVMHKVTFIKDSDVTVGYADDKAVTRYTKGQELYGVVDGFINGELIGYRKGLPDRVELTQLEGPKGIIEKYLIKEADIKIEIVAENYDDTIS